MPPDELVSPLASYASDPQHSRFAAGDPRPLAGRRVVVVHPAWHSCGSHQVFVNQIAAYRALGAEVDSLAVADFPGWVAGSGAHRAYLAATEDLIADRRFYAGMPRRRMAEPPFLGALWRWLHGDAAAMLCATAANAEVPADLSSGASVDLIHCNHFFVMPAARALKQQWSCPLMLDTHDVQARQFALRNEGRFFLRPRARYEEMLALEIAQMRHADLLIHLNDEEEESWRALLPEKKHALVYPTIKPMPTGPGGANIIIVASANYPNYLSVSWFLNEVRPRAPDVLLRIIGNVDQMIRINAPEVFAKHRSLFCGRIDDLEKAYAEAAVVLLPTTSGHGISIKTIEALSSGVPLIATREAFRGMKIDPAALANVTLAADAESFAAELLRVAQTRPVSARAREMSDTRQLYERLFGFDAYAAALAAQIRPMFAGKEVGSNG